MNGINIELPGVKLSISGVAPLIAFIFVVLFICGTSIYLIATKTDSVKEVISSFGGESSDRADKQGGSLRDSLEFFIPGGDGYEEGKKEFETWLSENNGWWGKTPMTNSRYIGEDEVIIEGYLYTVEDPVDDSPLTRNAAKAIHNQAIGLFGVKNLDAIWVEIVTERIQ